MNVGRILIGKPIDTKDLVHQAISKPVGLAVFASDALSSTAYATEEILIILSLAGGSAAVLGISIPIAIAIAIPSVISAIGVGSTASAVRGVFRTAGPLPPSNVVGRIPAVAPHQPAVLGPDPGHLAVADYVTLFGEHGYHLLLGQVALP